MTDNEFKWAKRYIRLAHEVATWSSCLSRQVGSVITVNRRVVATGYNGAPAGIKSCVERGVCLRVGSKSGENLDHCFAVHSEMNSILQAAKQGVSVKGGDIYVTTQPCSNCMKAIINSGIKRVFFTEPYNSEFAISLAKEAGVELIQINP